MLAATTSFLSALIFWARIYMSDAVCAPAGSAIKVARANRTIEASFISGTPSG
jgi:hypothetical protein